MARNEQRRQKALARRKAKLKARKPVRRDAPSTREALVARMARTASLPLREVRITRGWREGSLANIVITRDRPDAGLAMAAFLVDLGCLGVKNALCAERMSPREYEERLDSWATDDGGLVRCEPSLAAKIIRTGLAYAADLGFAPHEDFEPARQILGDIDASECDEEIVCGNEGKPFYVAGPRDNARRIIRQLERRLGPGGFHYIVPIG